jgi:hypothetical protein
VLTPDVIEEVYGVRADVVEAAGRRVLVLSEREAAALDDARTR